MSHCGVAYQNVSGPTPGGIVTDCATVASSASAHVPPNQAIRLPLCGPRPSPEPHVTGVMGVPKAVDVCVQCTFGDSSNPPSAINSVAPSCAIEALTVAIRARSDGGGADAARSAGARTEARDSHRIAEGGGRHRLRR